LLLFEEVFPSFEPAAFCVPAFDAVIALVRAFFSSLIVVSETPLFLKVLISSVIWSASSVSAPYFSMVSIAACMDEIFFITS
jgi:hypothetical protein